MSEALQPEPRPGLRRWAVTHLSPVRRYYADDRVKGVKTRDSALGAPFEHVSLRSYSPPLASSTNGTAPRVLYFAASSELRWHGARTGAWLASRLCRRLSLTVVVVQIGEGTGDAREAAFRALEQCALEAPSALLAVVGTGDGAALAARTAMRARDSLESGAPQLVRQALISPDFALLIGPPATAEAEVVSLVARLSELPPTLLQRDAVSGTPDPREDLPELLREAAVAVRVIDYRPDPLCWAEFPRAVGHSTVAADALEAFLRRGLLDNGFDVVPAWNLH
ncbi:hypothetical protein KPL76_12385 [Subtercola sp. PAMC28395]|uniref:hypothetical protein n=1 Tax=Subtercola sp. PAMC28395 TaxID=2846775 RepID=UPI001C0E35D8|nr:hypothetical protein [Subtercola sp. PAMC28395]QWT23500.1 hypothetical protein KPL76_12385 [Subtercola sp. PAMC28395]